MADPVSTITGTLGSGVSSISGYLWIAFSLLGIAIVITVIYFVARAFKSKEKWNLTIRVRQEDNQHRTLYLDPVVIKGKRVTLSNGLRLIYLQKAILGKKLFPLLNYYTRPGVYDLVVTSDNRIFIITGVTGIDEQRKELKVGVRYPGIDYALEEVNRDHAKLNKMDRRSDLLGIVKAAASAVIAIVILLMVIFAGKYYVDGKSADAAIAESELQLFQSLESSQVADIEHTNAMILLTEKMKEVLGTKDLRKELNNIGGT
jgi:hypothetical protein